MTEQITDSLKDSALSHNLVFRSRQTVPCDSGSTNERMSNFHRHFLFTVRQIHSVILNIVICIFRSIIRSPTFDAFRYVISCSEIGCVFSHSARNPSINERKQLALFRIGLYFDYRTDVLIKNKFLEKVCNRYGSKTDLWC